MADCPPEIELLPFRTSHSEAAPHLRRDIVCKRPFRNGGLRLETEEVDGKHVVHCYGHGGSGWTLAPGCGKRMLEMLVGKLEADWSDTACPEVTIIGGGVIGLFAAYYLARHRQDHPNSIGGISIIAHHFEDLTSHNAGGLFDPFLIGGEPDIGLLIDSYAFYHDIALGHGQHEGFDDIDIELLSTFSNDRDLVPSLVKLGYVAQGIPVNIKINDQRHGTFVHPIFYMDVALLMKHLFAAVTRAGVIAMRGMQIQRFAEIDSPVVFNCTGLGARELAKDPEVRPVIGHMVRLQMQPRALLDIQHNLHICANQREGLERTLGAFLARAAPDKIRRVLESHAGASQNILDLRFPLGWKRACDELIRAWFDGLHELATALASNPVEADPDIDGLLRVRAFSSQIHRNRVIDGIALFSRVAELAGDHALRDSLINLLAQYMPRYSKRYIFLIEGQYPETPDSSKTYPGLSYFMPILHESLAAASGGRFRYVSEPDTRATVTAGVAGGTTIDQESLDLAENRKEFDRIIQRLAYLGFR